MAQDLYDITIKDKDGVVITIQEQEDKTALFGVHFKDQENHPHQFVIAQEAIVKLLYEHAKEALEQIQEVRDSHGIKSWR